MTVSSEAANLQILGLEFVRCFQTGILDFYFKRQRSGTGPRHSYVCIAYIHFKTDKKSFADTKQIFKQARNETGNDLHVATASPNKYN
jgi:glutamine phosphoribosylpyrophosphate amidotransferase